MSRALPPLLVLAALAGCNAEPSSLLVKIVPADSEDVAQRVHSSDKLAVEFLSTARDLNGDEITYSFAWSVDGTARPEFTEALVPAEATSKGQVWTVAVTPNDGKKDGVAATAEVTILNTPPVAEANATLTQVVSTERLEMTGSGTDLDGDTVEMRYYWTNDGKGTPFDGPTVPAAFTYPGETWVGHAVAFDGEDVSEPATVEIQILNGKPTVDSITFNAEEVYTDTELVAIVEASDPDGQPVDLTYTWTVDGTQVSSGVNRTALSTSLFKKHQVIELTVVPNDGVDDGAPVSQSVTVLNSLPTTPEFTIFPAEPIPGIDDMRCQLVTPSTDADGDDISYEIGWTVDLLEFTAPDTTDLPGDTVPARMFYDDESWRCEVTPVDEDGAGLPTAVEVVPETWAGPRVFTTCDTTGRNGPKQTDCDSADGYNATTLEGEVVLVDGVQEWVVPVDGTYRITAKGAEGSASTSSFYKYAPGRGAVLRGDFELKRGDTLLIAVGQPGKTDGTSSGGGGATWVMMSDDTPLLVAGGGGSTSYYGSYYGRRNGCDALTSQYGGYGGGTATSGAPASTACRAKTSALRQGGSVPGTYNGNAGAGYSTNGADDPYAYIYGGSGGFSWFEGALGGKGSAYGGFGGGGGGNGSYAAGGGGGYSGGDASRNISGGGGSYNGGSNQSNSVGNAAEGEVTVDWLGF